MRFPTAPVALIVLSVPLIFGLIPRNRFYGFRTRSTCKSDQVWYPANKMAGKIFVVAGVIWLLVEIILPGWHPTLVPVSLLIAAGTLSVVCLGKILIP